MRRRQGLTLVSSRRLQEKSKHASGSRCVPTCNVSRVQRRVRTRVKQSRLIGSSARSCPGIHLPLPERHKRNNAESESTSSAAASLASQRVKQVSPPLLPSLSMRLPCFAMSCMTPACYSCDPGPNSAAEVGSRGTEQTLRRTVCATCKMQAERSSEITREVTRITFRCISFS